MRVAVFLDRDDTLIDTTGATRGSGHEGDLGDAALVRLLPGVCEALADLARAGFALVVWSSQGGVARGRYGCDAVERVNDRLRWLLGEAGVTLDGVYYCPFHPEGSVARFAAEHAWRKPGPGMLVAAARDLDLDLSRSWAVGDKPRDVQSAMAAGIAGERAILIGTSGSAGSVCADVPAAVRLIVAGPC